jgi:predicted RNA-binding Zn ribbon-like protein
VAGEKGLIGARDHVADAEAVRLRDLREAIRALAVANSRGMSPDAAAVALVTAAAGAAPLRVAVDRAGRTALAPAPAGVDGAVATLLGILHEAQLTGQWSRMKACRQCEYAFFDRSRNRSAAWCAMAICGNRTKNRAYYERRRAE